MKILITGGLGFIGQNLTLDFLKHQNEIYILHNTINVPIIFSDLNINLIKGSFGDTKILSNILPNIDIIIHLGWHTDITPNSSQFLNEIDNNVKGSLILIEQSYLHKVKKFIFISSGGTVYGNQSNLKIKEDDNTNPISSYGICKLMIENYLKLYNSLYNFNYLIFRVSNVYGEFINYKRNQGVIHVWLNKIYNHEEITIWGDGNSVRDYLHISDLVFVFNYALRYNFKERIYNLGYGKGHSLNDIIDILQNDLKLNFKLNFIHNRNVDVNDNVLNIDKLSNEIGYKPKISLIDGINRVWNSITKR